MQTVIETSRGWMIKCQSCNWHEFPRKGRPGASWTFNGNLEKPTFTPSMNELINGPGEHHNPEVPTRRCHFVVTDGMISFCSDCTHELAGQAHPLLPWPQAEVDANALRLASDTERFESGI